MSQAIAVTVKGFTVTACIDPKSKTEIPAKFKPQAVTALKTVQVNPPKGKTLQPYSVTVSVAIKAVPKGVKAEIKMPFFNLEPYSKKDKLLGQASTEATVQTTNPDKGDTEAAVDAALQDAISTVIGGIQDDAKKP